MKIINIKIDGIDTKDYPDFVDAYIVSADHEDGTPLTDSELDDLNADSDFVYSQVLNQLF